MENVTLLHDLILQKNLPQNVDSAAADAKLNWLRSQVIGQNATIHTPFGKRKLTYADHTASGRCLYYIEDYIVKNVLPFYGNTHTSDSYVGDRTMKNYHDAAEFVKKCLGGTQGDALLFCGSGTTASIKRLQEVMGIAIPSNLREKVLNSCLGRAERWVVFVGPYEHHSNLLSWRQSLAEVIEIGLDEEGLMDMDALKLQLQFYQTTGRPMLGSFSACSNVTGICSDTRSLSRLLHQFGAFVCFDFAASGPYVEIDMRSDAVDGYDAITLSPHKFLGGPGSPGILLMNKALYQLKYYPPSTCGGGTVDYVNSFHEKDTLYVSDIEEREHAGTPQIIQRVKAALAFQVKEYVGYKIIAEKEHKYIERALKRLLINPKIQVLGDIKVQRQAILSFIVYTVKSSYVEHVNRKSEEGIHRSSEKGDKRDKPLQGTFVATLLNDLFGIQARGGCACAGPYGHYLIGVDKSLSKEIRSAVEKGYIGVKPGWTRVSFPYYMSNEEFEFVISAIELIAIYGQRFLPFYHFNWNTGSWKLKTDVIKEALLKENSRKICSLSINNTSKVFQDRDMNLETPKVIASKTTANTHLSEYAYYLEIAKHIGDILPKFPSRRSVPTSINPDKIWFRL